MLQAVSPASLLQNKPSPVNVVMVSATMTKPIKRLISTTLPNARLLETTATLHRAVPGSRHRFLTLAPGANKLQQLEEVGRGCCMGLPLVCK